jgi:hypothetical protein
MYGMARRECNYYTNLRTAFRIELNAGQSQAVRGVETAGFRAQSAPRAEHALRGVFFREVAST